MSRILLADHSPHAQRMGERILLEEGFEVVAVTDGQTALLRLNDVKPDLILADIALPNRTGYEICDYVKNSSPLSSTRVVLTGGPLATLDKAEAERVHADGYLQKPFEASILLETLQPLLRQEHPAERTSGDSQSGAAAREPAAGPSGTIPAPRPASFDREQIRAAVILGLEASLGKIIEAITEEVMLNLTSNKRDTH
jgi:CheY-like chemotaxis protein